MAEFKLSIPEYTKENGAIFSWENGFMIKSEVVNDQVVITANEAGLISLAKQLLFLAQNETPVDCHYHLDEYNSLEAGSKEIVICKI